MNTQNDQFLTFKKGEIPMIGANATCEMFVRWSRPDGSEPTSEETNGFNVHEFFNSCGQYKGADMTGIYPIFREMTKEEAEEYLMQDECLSKQ